MTSNPSPLTLAENFIKATIAEPHYAGFDVEICSNLTVISASDTPRPTATSRIKVTQSLCNPTNHLHGGAQATLFDNCTTLALATVRKEGYWEMAGVTRNLDVTCLLPVAMGEEICIETEVISIGKRYGM